MNVSVLEAVEGALQRTRLVLFAPFDLTKWLVLGFCAFLASLGQGGAWPQFTHHLNGGRGGKSGSSLLDAWVLDNLPWMVFLGLGLLFAAFAIHVVLLWLSSRGAFLFLDGIVRDRGAVVEPWGEYARAGNSLFLFRLALGLIAFFLVLAVVAFSLSVGWQGLRDGDPGPALVPMVFLLFAVLLPVGIVLWLLSVLAKDFAVPIMLKRGVGVRRAFGVFFGEVLGGQFLSVVLFYLLKVVILIAFGVVTAVGVLCTCCIAALPYISSVVFLPLLVFMRAYPVTLLEQLGPDWTFFEEPSAA